MGKNVFRKIILLKTRKMHFYKLHNINSSLVFAAFKSQQDPLQQKELKI